MKRIKDLSTKEIYSIFFEAIKNKSGRVVNTKINGDTKPIFILDKNPFDKRVMLDLETLSIYQIRTFLGKTVGIDKILDMEDTKNEQRRNRLKEQLDKVSDTISDDLKKKYIEKLKLRRQHKTRKVVNKKGIKNLKLKKPLVKVKKPVAKGQMAKPMANRPMTKRPMVKKPMVRRPMVRRPMVR